MRRGDATAGSVGRLDSDINGSVQLVGRHTCAELGVILGQEENVGGALRVRGGPLF